MSCWKGQTCFASNTLIWLGRDWQSFSKLLVSLQRWDSYSFCYSSSLRKFIVELNTGVPDAGSKNKVHDPLPYGGTPYLMGFSATAAYIPLNINFLVLGTI